MHIVFLEIFALVPLSTASSGHARLSRLFVWTNAKQPLQQLLLC
jgi:hypothetical protein